MFCLPGVTNTGDLRFRKAAFTHGMSHFSTVGIGPFRNDFTLDGVANVANDRVAYSPPAAAVEEFKIQTNTYNATIGKLAARTSLLMVSRCVARRPELLR